MLPILFTIPKIHVGSFAVGPMPVHSFGVMMVLAFLGAMWLVRRRAPKFGIDPQKITDAGFWALVAGIVGARVVFIVQELPYYLKHTDELLSLQFQGLTSFGGLAFAVVALAIWARRERVPIARLFDLCAPGFAVGHIVGRVGCFLNGCCYGGVCPANFPFATHFEGAPGLHQPAQIYDALMNLAALLILLRLERGHLRMGQPAAFYLAAYGAVRFIYEFWRAGTPEQVQQGLASSTTIGSLPITEAQVAAGLLVLAGIVWWLLAPKGMPSQPDGSPHAVAPDALNAEIQAA